MPNPGVVAKLIAERNAIAPPVPDGKLVVRTVHGQTHEYPYKDMKPSGAGWRPQSNYLSVSTEFGRVNWPWHSILNFETHPNSLEFFEAHKRWVEAQEPTNG